MDWWASCGFCCSIPNKYTHTNVASDFETNCVENSFPKLSLIAIYGQMEPICSLRFIFCYAYWRRSVQIIIVPEYAAYAMSFIFWCSLNGKRFILPSQQNNNDENNNKNNNNSNNNKKWLRRIQSGILEKFLRNWIEWGHFRKCRCVKKDAFTNGNGYWLMKWQRWMRVSACERACVRACMLVLVYKRVLMVVESESNGTIWIVNSK